MESLKLRTKRRNSLYFGKYQYHAKCCVAGAGYTFYSKDIEDFKQKMLRMNRTMPKQVTVILDNWRKKYDRIDYKQIEKFFEWRKKTPRDQYLCRIQGDTVSIFSNDLKLLKTLKKLDRSVVLEQAELFGDPAVKYLKKEPKFRYRTFFKGKRAPESFKNDMLRFIKTYDHVIQVCPGLKNLVNETRRPYFRYLHSSYFVDYNDESSLTLLHMYFGDMMGRTYSLEKQPET